MEARHRRFHEQVHRAVMAERRLQSPRGLTVEEVRASWRSVHDEDAQARKASAVFGFDLVKAQMPESRGAEARKRSPGVVGSRDRAAEKRAMASFGFPDGDSTPMHFSAATPDCTSCNPDMVAGATYSQRGADDTASGGTNTSMATYSQPISTGCSYQYDAVNTRCKCEFTVTDLRTSCEPEALSLVTRGTCGGAGYGNSFESYTVSESAGTCFVRSYCSAFAMDAFYSAEYVDFSFVPTAVASTSTVEEYGDVCPEPEEEASDESDGGGVWPTIDPPGFPGFQGRHDEDKKCKGPRTRWSPERRSPGFPKGCVENNSGGSVYIWWSGSSGPIVLPNGANTCTQAPDQDVDHVRDGTGQWWKIGWNHAVVGLGGVVSGAKCEAADCSADC